MPRRLLPIPVEMDGPLDGPNRLGFEKMGFLGFPYMAVPLIAVVKGRSPKKRGQMKPVYRRDLDTLGALGVLAMAA
jgi:hypothetical protein